MAIAVKKVIESLREIVQDLLVPELKAVKVSVDSLREDFKELRVDLRESIDALRLEMKLRDEKHEQSMRHLAEKLDFAIDIRERLASLEARLPRQ
jgi:uncharacterized protein (DUF3084 family)